MKTVPFLDVSAGIEELRPLLQSAFERVLASGQFVRGAETQGFESEFAVYCGVDRCVGVGNGLDAIELILRAMDIGPGDEVLVPSNTFIATWLAVTNCGATPVSVAPDPRTHNISPDAIEAAITPRTRAVVPVHLYGQPADMQPLLDVSRRAGLRVIEDAAQAHGAFYDGRRTGSLADAAAFSFYPAKNLGALGDGGCVVTNDADLATRVRLLSNYGSRHKYDHEFPGVNSRLDELQCAFLRAKLQYLDEWNSRRRALAARYLQRLDSSALILPKIIERATPVWHLFVVRIEKERERIVDALRAMQIGVQIHYPIAPARSGAYADWARLHAPCPVADELSRQVLSLPIGPQMSMQQVDRVCDALLQAL